MNVVEAESAVMGESLIVMRYMVVSDERMHVDDEDVVAGFGYYPLKRQSLNVCQYFTKCQHKQR